MPLATSTPKRSTSWYGLADREHAEDWLLLRVVAKDVICELAAEQAGIDLAPDAVAVIDEGDGRVRIRCELPDGTGLDPLLRVERIDGAWTAAIEGTISRNIEEQEYDAIV